MGGYYQHLKNGVFGIFTEPSVWLAIRPEWQLPKSQIDAATRTRNGVIAAQWLAQKNGWKLGDTFTLKNGWPKRDGTRDWTFEVVGIMRNTESQGEIRYFLGNHAYLEETSAVGRGTVARFLLRIADATHAPRIARQIDTLLATPVPTRTQSEQDQAQTQLARIADFKFFTRAIMSAVFFALLFLTVNTTMESVRERTSELATLKTIGFTDTQLLALVMAESVTQFLIAAALGLAISAALFPLAKSIVQSVTLPLPVVVIGAVLAVAAAILSALLPALRAKRLNIVAALAVR
jgi:putative ABC transport system permease protein